MKSHEFLLIKYDYCLKVKNSFKRYYMKNIFKKIVQARLSQIK